MKLTCLKQRTMKTCALQMVRGQMLVAWLNGNALASINIVARRQTWLVPGWVTVCGRVNHLSM